jgi:hypothetical protein
MDITCIQDPDRDESPNNPKEFLTWSIRNSTAGWLLCYAAPTGVGVNGLAVAAEAWSPFSSKTRHFARLTRK